MRYEGRSGRFVPRTPDPCVHAVPLPRAEFAYSVFEKKFLPNPMDNLVHTMSRFQVRKDERLCTSHQPRIAIHDGQIGADERGQVRFVDHQQIGACDPRTAFPWDLVSARDVDNVYRSIDQFRTEAGGQIVTAALEEDDVEIRKSLLHFRNGVEIDGRVFSYRRVWAAARLHSNNAGRWKRFASHQEFHVFLCEDIVCDDAELITILQDFAQTIEERRLTRTHWTADTNFYGSSHNQERNNRL
jgi:hypothetical protein